jgi:hypothetical protein
MVRITCVRRLGCAPPGGWAAAFSSERKLSMAFRHLNRIDRGDYRTRGFTTNAVLTAIILVSLAAAVRALLEGQQ